MSRKQKYFLKQKLFGAAIVAISIAAIPFLDGDATHTVLMIPAGLGLIFTKQKVL